MTKSFNKVLLATALAFTLINGTLFIANMVMDRQEDHDKLISDLGRRVGTLSSEVSIEISMNEVPMTGIQFESLDGYQQLKQLGLAFHCNPAPEPWTSGYERPLPLAYFKDESAASFSDKNRDVGSKRCSKRCAC